MKPFIIPVVMLVVGLGAGAGAGHFLGGKAPEEACEGEDCEKKTAEEKDKSEKPEETPSYVRLQNQFVVPVVKGESVRSLVVMSLSLETEAGTSDQVYAIEPKLRDALLRVLFDHAHIGGFDGPFTESGRLSLLRVALLEAAQATLGPIVTDILITDIVRQEV
ncbi:flagellar basal body-associated protein FliL [Alphaproteobacteria bacterium GH1-50]|uniref:Flagellar protein FliL n=1 Tax=Kangsaoukella pontilimi TaxID=2691042 RepID=A0A7C9ME73_9RHOB|nr:flagellar basal body-associated FliL family protein [Kangsaoukella pontilimi]MXQ08172.1 flagellar basal body-associated protein FliL [Kangsaoukella pontilimi]